MTKQVSDYIALFAFFVVVGTFALLMALVADIFLAIWRRKHGHYGEDESDEDWDSGGGGWRDKPSGRPPGGGGPERDMNRQFHEVADAVGKTIEIEKREGEKVLT